MVPDTVHTADVDDVKVTGPPDDEFAESVRDPAVNESSASVPNVMVWLRNGRVEPAVATVDVAVVPFPSRPALLFPQHQMVDGDAAHVESFPVVTTWADETDATVTGPWFALVPAWPLPTCPLVLLPKHATAPVVRNKHV